MLRISISKTGTPTRSSTFDKREISVGRTSANDLVIAEPGVSGNHARILHFDGELTLIDLDSTNGTFVNGQRIQGPHIVQAGDEVYICAHRISFELDAPSGRSSPPSPSFPPPINPLASSPPPSGGPPPVFPTVPPVFPTLPPVFPTLPPSLGGPSPIHTPVEGIPAAPHSSPAPSPDFPPLVLEEAPSFLPEVEPPPVPESAPTGPDSLPAFPEEDLGLPDLPPSISVFPIPPLADADLPPPPVEHFPPLPEVLNDPGPALDATPPPAFPPRAVAPPRAVPSRGEIALPAHEEIQWCDAAFANVFAQLSPGESPPIDRPEARTQARRLLQDALATTSLGGRFDAPAWAATMTEEMFEPGRLATVVGSATEVLLRGPRGSSEHTFSGARALALAVRRATGQPFDDTHPVVSASTTDGAFDVHAVHDSIAPDGPLVRMLRRSYEAPSLSALVQRRLLGPGTASLLEACVQGGRCLMICATPGADPSSLLAALAQVGPSSARQVWVGCRPADSGLPAGILTLRPPVTQGGSGATLMVRAAVGLEPARLWVADVAGIEAAEVLAAFGDPRRGGAFALRAPHLALGIDRMASLVGLSVGREQSALRLMIAHTVDLLIGIDQRSDGTTILTHVAEPQVAASGVLNLVDIVTLDPRSGSWVRGSGTPTFLQSLQQRGFSVDLNQA